jgi:flavin-dependent dehydrogenase
MAVTEKFKESLEYDVVIVGSGPAGAATAKALTGQGLNTVIIERAKLPRYKMCSGMLFPSALSIIADDFGEIPEDIYSEPKYFHGARLCLGMDMPFVEAPLGGMSGEDVTSDELTVNAKRPEFDYWLCSKSDASIVDECAFKGFQEQDPITVAVKHQGDDTEIKTKYLIGADGTMSSVRRALSRDFDKGLRLLPQYEEWYVGTIDLEPGWFYMFYDRKITGFFACVIHKDGMIIAVTGAERTESAKEYFRKFREFLEQRHRLSVKETVKTHACVLHDMSATDNFFLGDGNTLLVGEAGGFNRCAEGITSALITGKAAGESILKSIETGEPALSFYSSVAAPEMQMCSQVNRFMEEALGSNPFTRD